MTQKKSISNVEFPKNLIQSVFIVLIFIATSGIISVTLTRVLNQWVDKKLVLFLGYILGFVSILFVVKLLNKKYTYSEYNIKFQVQKDLLILLIASIFAFATPIVKLFESLMSEDSIQTQDPFASITYLIGGIFIGPIIEEVIFRGIILEGLLNNKNISKLRAILYSSILFAVIHINISQILTALIIGVICSISYTKDRNILSAIILHMIANISITLASYIHYKYGDSQINSIENIFGDYSLFIIIFSAIIFIIVMCRVTKVKYHGN